MRFLCCFKYGIRWGDAAEGEPVEGLEEGGVHHADRNIGRRLVAEIRSLWPEGACHPVAEGLAKGLIGTTRPERARARL